MKKDHPPLLFFDENSILMVTTEMLNVLGFSAHPVMSLDEAQEAISDAQAAGWPFEIAIIDLVLPGTHTGMAVNHLLKSLSPELKTIAISGKLNDPAIKQPREYGFNASLTKPYSLMDIRRVMGAV